MLCGHPQFISGRGNFVIAPFSRSSHISCHSQPSTVKWGQNNIGIVFSEGSFEA